MWFKKSREKAGFLSPEQRRVSAAGVRNAFWRGTFRTISYVAPGNDLLGRFYLKAVRRADDTWSVFRVTERDETVNVSPPEKAGLDFMGALDFLAVFEKSSTLEMNRQPAIADEKKTLGLAHYQAFGEREGFIFDDNGLPHETESGEPVTPGDFKKPDMDSFKDHFEPAQAELKKAFNAASNEELLKLMGQTVDQGALDEVLAVLRKRDALNPLKEPLNYILNFWGDGLRYGFDHCVRYPNSSKMQSLYSDEMSFEEAIPVYIRQVDEVFGKYKGKNIDVSDVGRGIEICRFWWKLRCARQAFRDRAQDKGGEAEILRLKNECMDSLKKLGMTELEAGRVEASILSGLGANDREVPQVVKDFVGSINRADQNIVDEARQVIKARTRVAALKP